MTPSPPPRGTPWPWIAAAGLAVAVAAVIVLWPTTTPPPATVPVPAKPPTAAVRPPEPPPPLRFASVDPLETTAVRIPIGEQKRFAVAVAEADRHPDLGVVWRVDGREAGRGSTFEFRPTADDGGATRTVEVVATAKDAHVSRTWTVSVPAVPPTVVAIPQPPEERKPPQVAVAPTTPPATIAPVVPATLPRVDEGTLEIAARTPAADRVALVQGDSLEFGVRLADPAGSYRYAWFLDGRPVGSEPTWRYRAAPGPVSRAPVKVEVEVSDDRGRTSERIAWQIDMRTPPPKIVETRPAGRELRIALGETPELMVRATPGRPDAVLRYEWRIDRMPARITKQGTLAIPYDLAAGKHSIEVIAVDDEDDRRSQPQRFTVTVAPAETPEPPRVQPRERERAAPAPPEPSRPAPVETSSTSSSRVTEAEARQWMERLRSAWERRDRNALRELGELPDGKVPRGKVTIGEASIIIDAAGANVWYDRIEDGVTASKRARLVRDPNGRVIRR